MPSFTSSGALRAVFAVSAGFGVVAVIGLATGTRPLFWIGAVVAVLSGIGGVMSMSDNSKAAGLRLELFDHGLVTVANNRLLTERFVLGFRWDR